PPDRTGAPGPMPGGVRAAARAWLPPVRGPRRRLSPGVDQAGRDDGLARGGGPDDLVAAAFAGDRTAGRDRGAGAGERGGVTRYGFDTDELVDATGALVVYAVYRSRDMRRYKVTPDIWDQITRFVKAAATRSIDIPEFIARLSPRLSCGSIK